MRVFAKLLVASALAGCNQVWGLDATTLAELPDLDDDGVPDAADNCPTVSNEPQDDLDGDGFGDACDGCVNLATAANHDEDADLIGDECDSCPGTPDFRSGADADDDGVPDACERTNVGSPGRTRRVAFDPFVELADSWTPAGVPWKLTNDSITTSAIAAIDDRGLHRADPTLAGSATVIDVGFRTPEVWQPGDRFGVGLADPAGNLVAVCAVECNPTCKGRTGPSGPPLVGVQSTPVGRVRLLIVNGAAWCSFVAVSVTAGTALAASGTPVIFGSSRVQITYVAAWVDEP